jgi:RNA-binding protein PNO1
MEKSNQINIDNNIDIQDNIKTGEEEVVMDEELMSVEVENVIKSIAEKSLESKNNTNVKQDYRRVLVPMNRMKPLKENWTTIVKALVEHMKIQVKMNVKGKCVEMRSCDSTADVSALQKSEEFLRAFMCGFDLQDSIAMLRLEDLYLETFEIKDGTIFILIFFFSLSYLILVKNLHGDHLSRCIGRICGEKGKTKNAIENATRTRLIVQDSKINLLGSSVNINLARRAVCSLILGAPPGKVYASLRIVGKKINENY